MFPIRVPAIGFIHQWEKPLSSMPAFFHKIIIVFWYRPL